MAQTVTGIDVELSEKQREALVAMAPGARPSEALSGLATSALQDIANGGMILTPEAVKRIKISVANPYDEDEVVKMIEKGAKRFGQSEIIEYVLDPTLVAPMRQWAKDNGRTMQGLVQDCMATAFDNEWFYEIPPHHTILLTPEQFNTIRQALGKIDDDPLFGADIAAFVEQAATAPEVVLVPAK